MRTIVQPSQGTWFSVTSMKTIVLKIVDKFFEEVIGHKICSKGFPGGIEIVKRVIVNMTWFFELITATVIVEDRYEPI